MQTTSYGLNELLDRARGGTLTIPRFQRKFTWKRSQTTLLVDSISRSYPIGSLLLLSKNSELKLNVRSIEAEIHSSEDNNQMSKVEDEYYVLDGQQRLTSIARVFLDADPKKCYYFDLKKILDSHEKEEDSWIACPNRGKSTPERRDKKGRLLRADIALKQATADIYVSEYIEDSGDFSEFSRNQVREAAAKIKGIFEIIRNYKVPAVIVERNSNIESVCRIFETINSTGTGLKTFDLAVARFYSEGVDLNELWSKTQKEHKILKDFEVNGERVLQVLYLVTAMQSQKKYVEPTRGNLLSLESNQIEREWGKSSESLAKAYKWAQAQGAQPKRAGAISTLPSDSVLLSLAAVESLEGNIWKDHTFIRRWYFSKTIQTGVSQSLNYQIGQDSLELWKYVKDHIRPELPQVTLSVEILLRPISSDVRYKALQNVMATTIKEDLISEEAIDPESILHNHHIFPKSFRTRLGEKLDSICNRITILSKSNQHLGNKPPQTYFKDMVDSAHAEGTLGGLKTRMEHCLIPGDPEDPQWPNSFSIDRFEEFCRARADLIIKRVGEIIGNSLQIVSPSSDDEMEDEDD